jgi:hypothetical protein
MKRNRRRKPKDMYKQIKENAKINQEPANMKKMHALNSYQRQSFCRIRSYFRNHMFM